MDDKNKVENGEIDFGTLYEVFIVQVLCDVDYACILAVQRIYDVHVTPSLRLTAG